MLRDFTRDYLIDKLEEFLLEDYLDDDEKKKDKKRGGLRAEKDNFSLNKLMQNNKFIFILAIVISFSIWIYSGLGATNDTNVTLSNIPIQIELSDEARDNGLQIFQAVSRLPLLLLQATEPFSAL